MNSQDSSPGNVDQSSLTLERLAELVKDEIRMASSLNQALVNISNEIDRFSDKISDRCQQLGISLPKLDQIYSKTYARRNKSSSQLDDISEYKYGKKVRIVVPDQVRFQWLGIFENESSSANELQDSDIDNDPLFRKPHKFANDGGDSAISSNSAENYCYVSLSDDELADPNNYNLATLDLDNLITDIISKDDNSDVPKPIDDNLEAETSKLHGISKAAAIDTDIKMNEGTLGNYETESMENAENANSYIETKGKSKKNNFIGTKDIKDILKYEGNNSTKASLTSEGNLGQNSKTSFIAFDSKDTAVKSAAKNINDDSNSEIKDDPENDILTHASETQPVTNSNFNMIKSKSEKKDSSGTQHSSSSTGVSEMAPPPSSSKSITNAKATDISYLPLPQFPTVEPEGHLPTPSIQPQCQNIDRELPEVVIINRSDFDAAKMSDSDGIGIGIGIDSNASSKPEESTKNLKNGKNKSFLKKLGRRLSKYRKSESHSNLQQ